MERTEGCTQALTKAQASAIRKLFTPKPTRCETTE